MILSEQPKNHNTGINYANPALITSLALISGGVGVSGWASIPPTAYNWSVPAVYSADQVGILSNSDEIGFGDISVAFMLASNANWLRQTGYAGSQLTDTLIAEPPVDRNITSTGAYFEQGDKNNFKTNESVLSHATIESVAQDVFGQMRSATAEENESVREYFDSISVGTGINFFDLL